jgi:hypothetical protein
VQSSIANNTLFYGDNLPILREHIPDESIDLVYLDPPFNSNRNYSVLFRDESGKHSEAQIGVFVTLEDPSGPMKKEALSAGYHRSQGWGSDYPRMQILTVEQLLHGAQVEMPPQHGTFREAQRARAQEPDHLRLDL